MNKNTLSLATLALLFSSATLVSCSKEKLDPPVTEAPVPESALTVPTDSLNAPVDMSMAMATTTTTSTATPYRFSINYAGRPNTGYTTTQASPDYKNLSYWMGSRSTLYNGMLTTTLARYTVGINGGTLSKMNVPDASEYTVSFRMMFDSNFDFSAGGKVGFGALIGTGYTGGVPGWDGNGGSARIMWYKGAGGRVYLKPYIYHKDQPGTYGNDFGKTYPATGNIAKGVWHTVKIYVKSNTGWNTDGRLTMTINGSTLIDQPIRWTTNNANRLINNIVFETFRGGSESYWQSATDGKIYFNSITYGVGRL